MSARPIHVVVASNSQGTSIGIRAGANYPSELARLLGPNYLVSGLLGSGWTLTDIVNLLDDNIIALRPDVMVLNFGIMEATQRILSEGEKKFLSIMPFGRQITGALFRQRARVLRIRKRLGIQTRLMPLEKFEHMMQTIVFRLREAGIVPMPLQMPMIPDNGQALGHPYVNDDIGLYNAVIKHLNGLSIDDPLDGWNAGSFQPGTVHFSEAGHQTIARVIAKTIRGLELRLPTAHRCHPAEGVR